MKRLVAWLLILVLALPLPVMADSYDDMLQKAQQYIVTGDFDKALACFDLAVRLDADRAQAYCDAAQMYYSHGEYGAALSLVEMALEKEPLHAASWELKCLIDLARDDAKSFGEDVLFAEVCGVFFLADRKNCLLAGDMCMRLAHYAQAAEYYYQGGEYALVADALAKLPTDSLTEDQRGMYKRALVFSGQSKLAEEMGLIAANSRDPQLDMAFARGKLTLEVVEDLCPKDALIFMPEQYAAYYEMSEEDVAYSKETILYELKNDGGYLLGVSPDGMTKLILVDQNGGFLLAVRGSVITVLCPNTARGVEDVHGNMRTLYYDELHKLRMWVNNVAWSPDGRYAVLCCPDMVHMGRYMIDPIVLDTVTGDVVLLSTYANKIREENFGAMVSACFSADGKQLFCVMTGYFGEGLFGMRYSGNYVLMSYDLETGKATWQGEMQPPDTAGGLQRLSDGTMMMVTYPYSARESAGIAQIFPYGKRWFFRQFKFDSRADLAARVHTRSIGMDYSANSGYAVVLETMVSNNYSASFSFLRVRPEEMCAGLNEHWVIEKETNKLCMLSDEEWQQAAMEQQQTLYQQIYTVLLSPCGNYAFVETLDTEPHGMLVQLESMTAVPVEGFRAGMLRDWGGEYLWDRNGYNYRVVE